MDISRRQLWVLAGLGLVPAGELMIGGRGSFIDHGHQVIDDMFAEYGSRDLAVTASTAGTHLRGLVALSDQRMTGRTRTELLALEARVGALRARALTDAGQTGPARDAITGVLARSARAGHRDVLVYAYATRSAVELQTGQTAAALESARKAVAICPNDPRGHLAAARAHAARSEADQAEQVVRAAEQLVDAADAPMTGPPAPGVISRLEWARAAVDVHARIGDGDQARRVLNETVAAVPVQLRGDTAQALGASYARTLATTDPDEGAHILHETLLASMAMGTPARSVVERVDAFLLAAPRDHIAVYGLRSLRREVTAV
ncbi:hypothetical protein [Parafrankia sp. EUN1f]|uniref:hypothetical protein n=1 Tax=Parafrankia sp. EUN1f TaxID=102897 RepID=UPI0001C44A70|nr:hypothetical protein [Parafrankia sp. EUN1f]EFC84487.1 hypothetical protein FrEUN1fDRAFT_2417 [Parafrankia sp. EUN1f]